MLKTSVRLFNFIEQNDTVRFPSDCFGQLSALVVADISRRSSDQSDTECFSIYSDISIRIIFRSVSNKDSDNAFASSVLPTPVDPGK